MTTAVDSSILFDILTADVDFGERSHRLLRTARDCGVVIACPVVWAEVAAQFEDSASARHQLEALEISFDPFDQEVSEFTGRIWKIYRRSGGRRERAIPDFFVGAHALLRGGRLLSRDSGFYRRYFGKLEVSS
ncbi:MAG: type II toxin-antitoxin system VapC family toxin [Terriglobales bacterium]